MQAGIQTSQSNVEQLSTVLENVDAGGNVIAPASGTVTSLSAVKDGYVSASMPVAVIDGAEVMEVSVSVSEALLPKLAIGDEAVGEFAFSLQDSWTAAEAWRVIQRETPYLGGLVRRLLPWLR